MNCFNEYIETKIRELSLKEKSFNENYQQDDAVFIKMKINVYDICKTIFGVFKKVKPEDRLNEEFMKKLDELEKTWSESAEKASQFGDLKKVAAEEAKLEALADIKSKFIELRGE